MRDFSKIGFITFGNPNHYDGTKLMRKELRRRLKEDDAKALAEVLEGEDIKSLHQDVIADYLSDAAPEGYVFEVRKDDRGNSNWGYFDADHRQCFDGA